MTDRTASATDLAGKASLLPSLPSRGPWVTAFRKLRRDRAWVTRFSCFLTLIYFYPF